MGFLQLQAPAQEPVTLTDTKNYCRVTHSLDDSLITDLITAAREQAEAYTRRRFVLQKWRMLLDAFPGYIDQRLGGNIQTTPLAIGATSYMAGIRWAIVPPWSPVQGIDALSFLDPQANTVTMVPGIDYIVDVHSNPARVSPQFGKFWPISRIQTESVWIDWTCGWGGPITVSMTAGSALLTTTWKFYPTDVGKSITVTGAGPGSPMPDLVTTVAAVDQNGVATLAAPAATNVTNVSIWWGTPVPASIRMALYVMVASQYNTREEWTADKINATPFVARALSTVRIVTFP